MEISTPYPDTPDRGSMMIGAELLPLSNPDFESGPPGELSIEIARVVDRGIRESNAIDTKKLCISPGEKAWMVVVDICTINVDGNLFDAASLAALAAIKDTKFPKLNENFVIDYKTKTDKKIPLLKEPIEITVFKLGPHLIVDPIPDEEEMMDSRLTVAVTQSGDLCALQKGGDAPLSSDDIDKMVKIAIDKAGMLRKHL